VWEWVLVLEEGFPWGFLLLAKEMENSCLGKEC
jgi:hypothetical protein